MRYLIYKVPYFNYRNGWPRNGLQQFEMPIVRYNIFCIRRNRTIDKLIVIRIDCYQSKMEIGFLIESSTQSGYSLNDTMSNFPCGLIRQNFFVLI